MTKNFRARKSGWSVKSDITYGQMVKGIMSVRKALTDAQYETAITTDSIEMMLSDNAMQSDEVSMKVDEFNECVRTIQACVQKAISASDEAKKVLKAIGATNTAGGTGDLMGTLFKDRYSGDNEQPSTLSDDELVKAMRWFRQTKTGRGKSIYGRSYNANSVRSRLGRKSSVKGQVTRDMMTYLRENGIKFESASVDESDTDRSGNPAFMIEMPELDVLTEASYIVKDEDKLYHQKNGKFNYALINMDTAREVLPKLLNKRGPKFEVTDVLRGVDGNLEVTGYYLVGQRAYASIRRGKRNMTKSSYIEAYIASFNNNDTAITLDGNVYIRPHGKSNWVFQTQIDDIFEYMNGFYAPHNDLWSLDEIKV